MNVQPLVLCLREWPFSRPAQARQCPLSSNNSSPGTRSNIISLSKKVSVVPRELATWVSARMQMSPTMTQSGRLQLVALCSLQTSSRTVSSSLATVVKRYLRCCRPASDWGSVLPCKRHIWGLYVLPQNKGIESLMPR